MLFKTIATLSVLTGTIMFAGTLPVEAARAVVAESTNVRSGPGSSNRVVGRVRSGDRVNITRCDRSHRWCHIETRRTRNGWVRSWYLDRVSGSRPGNRSSGICFFGRRGEVCVNR